MRWFLMISVWLGVGWMPSNARATVVVWRSLEGQIAAAERIVWGRIVGFRAWEAPESRYIYTDVEMEILDVFKGPTAGRLTFRQLGGQIGERIAFVPGGARFRKGEEVVLFFEAQRKAGYLFVLDLAAGKYSVTHQHGETWLHRDASEIAFHRPPAERATGPSLFHLSATEKPLRLSELRETIQRALRPTLRMQAFPTQADAMQKTLRRIFKQHSLRREPSSPFVTQAGPLLQGARLLGPRPSAFHPQTGRPAAKIGFQALPVPAKKQGGER